MLLLGASTSASARPSGRTAASDVAPDGREPCDATRALRADRERCPAAGASVFLTEPVGFKLPRAE